MHLQWIRTAVTLGLAILSFQVASRPIAPPYPTLLALQLSSQSQSASKSPIDEYETSAFSKTNLDIRAPDDVDHARIGLEIGCRLAPQ